MHKISVVGVLAPSRRNSKKKREKELTIQHVQQEIASRFWSACLCSLLSFHDDSCSPLLQIISTDFRVFRSFYHSSLI